MAASDKSRCYMVLRKSCQDSKNSPSRYRTMGYDLAHIFRKASLLERHSFEDYGYTSHPPQG
jgi:hypothetical protein